MKAYEIRENGSWDLTEEYYLGEIIEFCFDGLGTVAIIKSDNDLYSRYIADIKVD